MNNDEDVLVIGAGIIGCSIAFELSRQGRKVTLVDRGEVGRGASWAAGGILTPIHLADYPASLGQLCSASQELYPEFIGEIQRLSGIDPEYRTTGVLFLITDEQDAADAEKLEQWKRDHGRPVTRLQPAEVFLREPALSKQIRGALDLPDISQVRNNRLTRAIAVAAGRLGCTIVTGASVEGFVRQGERVAAVETSKGRIEADRIIITTGCWSPEQARQLGWDLPVKPVRGQMLLTESDPPLIRTMLLSKDQYLVPRKDGKILIGSTVEEVGYDSNVTPEGVKFLQQRACDMVPALRELPILQSWAGLRPATPDRLPYIGPLPGVGNVFVAAGHFRNGILLAPITARLVAESLSGKIPTLPLDAFRLDR